MATAPAVRAVIFDMDGVLFEGRNFWLDLHKRYGGSVAAAQELVARYLTSDYAMLADKIAGELWRGNPVEPYEALVRERRYQPGVRATLAFLHEAGIRTAIVSSGPDLLALRAQAELGIDVVRANGLEVRDGWLTGGATLEVHDARKAEVGREVMRELGVDPAETAAVGDSESDAALAEVVGLPIAYDSSSERLDEVARFHLRHGELLRLREILQRARLR